MKKAFIGIVFILVAGFCFGQQTVIVPPCVNRGSGFSANDIATLNDLILNAVQRQERFDVPDREALATMTEENKFQMSDWSDETKTVQMGKALNANYIVRSILAPLGDGVNLLTVRIVDINTTRILGRAAELEFTTVRDARSKMDAFLKSVTSNITTDYDKERAQEARQQSEWEQSRRAAEAETKARRTELDADWTNKRWYIGFSVGGGHFATYEGEFSVGGGPYKWQEQKVAGGVVLFKAELDIAKYFAFDFDIGLAIGELSMAPVEPYLKILAHIPIRFNFGLDIGALGGIYGGEPDYFGVAEGASVGYKIGKGEIFAELVFLQPLLEHSIGTRTQNGIVGTIGYKVGLGSRK
jgi:hypothetical protein